MLKKCYFEPCLLQVLGNFCVLISIINPIWHIQVPAMLLIAFCGKFYCFYKLFMPKLLSQSKHKEFETNSTLKIRDQKERRAENAKKLEL